MDQNKPNAEGSHVPPDSRAPRDLENLSQPVAAPPLRPPASPDPEAGRASGAPPADLNAFVLDVDSSILNIDTSLRRLCAGLEDRMLPVLECISIDARRSEDTLGGIEGQLCCLPRLAVALERVAAMAEARELREGPSYDIWDEREPGAAPEEVCRAWRARMASLLSVSDQVAAESPAPRDGDGGEAASRGSWPERCGRAEGRLSVVRAHIEALREEWASEHTGDIDADHGLAALLATIDGVSR
jgi:hypothetical protein